MRTLLRYCGLLFVGLLLGSSWPLLSARLRPALPMYQSRILPDFVPVPQPLGFPCTGAALAADGSLWAGVGLARPSEAAGVVHLSPDMRVLRVVTLRSLGLPAASVQGVATHAGRTWFIAKGAARGKLVEVDASGRLRRVADIVREEPNGLAYDTRRHALILMHDDRTVQWIDAATWDPLPIAGTVSGTMPDHLYYDARDDRLFVTSGRNQRDGNLSAYDVPTLGMTANYTLQGADAIEGVAISGARILVMNDAGTHQGLPQVNRLLEYRLPD
jgi:hypothetical protein